MLALLKSGRSCVAVPAARAAAVRASAAGAASCRLLSGGGGPVVRSLVSLHRRLVSALVQQSRALLRLSVVQCEFVLIYRTRRSLQVRQRALHAPNTGRWYFRHGKLAPYSFGTKQDQVHFFRMALYGTPVLVG